MTSLVLILLMIADVSNAQSANYVSYDNFSAVDFDNSTGCFVPSLSECLALSNAAPLANGVVYNDGLKTCKVLTATNNEVLVKLHAKAGWVTFVKNNSDAYRLIFKMAAEYTGTKADAYATQLFSGVTQTYTTTYNSAVASLVRANSCNCTYRNPMIDYWSIISLISVKLEFFSGGLTTASLTFDAKNSTLSSWFNPAKLIGAVPYSTSTMWFNINLKYYFDDPTYKGRTFQIFGGYASPCYDTYYILVSSFGSCDYDSTPWPKILYSATLQASTHAALLKAEFFSISARFNNRVVIVP